MTITRRRTKFSGRRPTIFGRRRFSGIPTAMGVALLTLAGAAAGGPPPPPGTDEAPRILVLADDRLGANWNIRDDQPSIKERFLSYGWKLDLVSVKKSVASCAFAHQATGMARVEMDRLISEISTVRDYAAVVVLPGQSHENLLTDSKTLDLLREAAREGIVLAGFCRGVRLLAAAGIIRNRSITGHPDYADEYRNAGAEYIGFQDLEEKSDAPPPVIDGNLVTTVRSKYYREKACAAIRAAVEKNHSKKRPPRCF